MSSGTSLQEKLDALMRQNEMPIKKIHEDAQRESKTKAQNEHL